MVYKVNGQWKAISSIASHVPGFGTISANTSNNYPPLERELGTPSDNHGAESEVSYLKQKVEALEERANKQAALLKAQEDCISDLYEKIARLQQNFSGQCPQQAIDYWAER